MRKLFVILDLILKIIINTIILLMIIIILPKDFGSAMILILELIGLVILDTYITRRMSK